MKKTKIPAFLLAAVMMLSMAACGGPDAPANTSTAPAAAETTTKEAPSTAAPSSEASTEKATEAPAESTAEAPTDPETEAPTETPTEAETEPVTEPHAETAEEFQAALVEFLNMDLLNGFLHTDFDDPRDALLGEAVQQGNDYDASVDYKKAYAENGRDYLDGPGIRAVSEEHMNEFLQKAAGITPADMHTNAESLYLKGYHCYTAQSGDSNYHPMGIVNIDKKEDGTTVITYKSDGPEQWWVWYPKQDGEWDLQYAPLMQMTLVRDGNGGFNVVSNHSLKLTAQNFMNESKVNGFLISAYADARDARLFEVLYQSREKDLDLEAIMKAHGTTPESGTGMRAVTMEHLSEITRRVTGYDAQALFDSNFIHTAFADMTAINKTWYPEEKVFITQAGDTNFQKVSIDSIELGEDGVLTIIYRADGGYAWTFWFANEESMDNIYSAKSMVCRMKQDENGDLKILSNRPYEMSTMSREEAEITMFFNRFRLTNGMLHSVYTDVRDVDFSEIVYQGYDNVDNETVDKAFAAQGRTRDYSTGFGAVLDVEMADFLYGVTGYQLEEFEDRGSVHFDGFGFYGMEHGDSNYEPVIIDEIILGDDGSIAVYYHTNWGSWDYVTYDANGKAQYKSAKQMLAVLERSDDYWYHIISNEAK